MTEKTGQPGQLLEVKYFQHSGLISGWDPDRMTDGLLALPHLCRTRSHKSHWSAVVGEIYHQRLSKPIKTLTGLWCWHFAHRLCRRTLCSANFGSEGRLLTFPAGWWREGKRKGAVGEKSLVCCVLEAAWKGSKDEWENVVLYLARLNPQWSWLEVITAHFEQHISWGSISGSAGSLSRRCNLQALERRSFRLLTKSRISLNSTISKRHSQNYFHFAVKDTFENNWNECSADAWQAQVYSPKAEEQEENLKASSWVNK